MFVVGLVLGPLLGLAGGIALSRSPGGEGKWGWAIVGFLLVAVAFFSFLPPELRLGLIAGVLLGLLLAHTPVEAPADPSPGQADLKSVSSPKV